MSNARQYHLTIHDAGYDNPLGETARTLTFGTLNQALSRLRSEASMRRAYGVHAWFSLVSKSGA